MILDLAINNAELWDGTGSPSRRGAVGIRANRIVEVADSDLTAARMIDAGRKVVCPGFIDLHSNADFSTEPHPTAETQLSQGVTTPRIHSDLILATDLVEDALQTAIILRDGLPEKVIFNTDYA